MMAEKWITGKTIHWFVIDSHGTVYLSTSRTSKRKAIAAWLLEVSDAEIAAAKHWRYWHRAGYRCLKVKLKMQVQP